MDQGLGSPSEAAFPSNCTTPLPYSIGETNPGGLSWTVQHPELVLHCGYLPVGRKGTHPSSYPFLVGSTLIYLPIGLESRLYPSFPLFYLSLSFSFAPSSFSKYLHAVSTSPVDVAPGFFAAAGY